MSQPLLTLDVLLPSPTSFWPGNAPANSQGFSVFPAARPDANRHRHLGDRTQHLRERVRGESRVLGPSQVYRLLWLIRVLEQRPAAKGRRGGRGGIRPSPESRLGDGAPGASAWMDRFEVESIPGGGTLGLDVQEPPRGAPAGFAARRPGTHLGRTGTSKRFDPDRGASGTESGTDSHLQELRERQGSKSRTCTPKSWRRPTVVWSRSTPSWTRTPRP